MRTLKFVVDGQIINLDPNCDFSNLVPGTEGYLKAEFRFSSEWTNCAKVASFWSSTGKEYTPQILEDGYSCVIPSEALEKRIFKVQVLGARKNFKIISNKVEVVQNGGEL